MRSSRKAGIQLGPQAADMGFNDGGLGREVEAPDILQQHRAGNDLALMQHQIFQHLVFARLELDEPPGAADRPGEPVKLQIRDAQRQGFRRDGIAAGQGRHAGGEFCHGEGFDEIIIATRAQPVQPVSQPAKGCEKQSRRFYPSGAERAQQG